MINKKVEVHQFGNCYAAATHIVDCPIENPADGMLRIRNHFAGVNGFFDHMTMRGGIQYLPLTPPFDLGVESVGIVEAAGKGTSFKVGDAVASTGLGSAYRHRHIIAAEKAYLIPSAAPEYLAIVPTGISALIALEKVAELKPKETVIISAAAGGLGHILVQLAVQLGCNVIGIAGSDEKCDFVKSLGASECINYKKDDVADVLSTQYKDAIDVAMDTVGGDIFDAMLDNIAPLGRVVVSGSASDILEGSKPVLQPRVYNKVYWKGASVRGFMNALLQEFHRDAAERLFAMMEDGNLSISVDSKHFSGLKEIPKAAKHMMSGCNIGKTVLDLR